MKQFDEVFDILKSKPFLLLLFNTIRRGGSVQKSKVGLNIPVSKPTLYSLIQEILDLGLISEIVTSENGKHRRSTVININKNQYYSLGIDIHMEGTSILLLDIDQTIVARHFFPNIVNELGGVSKDNRNTIIRKIQESVPIIIKEANIQNDQIIAIGISDASFVDSKDNISVYNRYIPEWKDVPIGNILSRIIPVKTFLERDVNVTALAELRNPEFNSISNALCVSLRHGIGLGIFIHGRIYTGQSGNAGEWSVMKLFSADGKREDDQDLDTLLGISTLKEIAKLSVCSETLKNNVIPESNKSIIMKLFDAYEKKNEKVRLELDKYIKLMALHLTNLIYIFDIEHIAITGHFSHCGEEFRINLENEICSKIQKFRKITIIKGQLGTDAAVLGAAYMAQERLLNPLDYLM